MPSYASLQHLISRVTYKPGWRFRLQSGWTHASGTGWTQPEGIPVTNTTGLVIPQPPLFLIICAAVQDSNGHAMIQVEHRFTVPPEELVMPWHRWLLECILDVERHETCEWLSIEGHRPFYPEHGPDARPYAITEREPVPDAG